MLAKQFIQNAYPNSQMYIVENTDTLQKTWVIVADPKAGPNCQILGESTNNEKEAWHNAAVAIITRR